MQHFFWMNTTNSIENKLTLHNSTSNVWKSPLVSSLITSIRSFLYSKGDNKNADIFRKIYELKPYILTARERICGLRDN